MESWRMAWRRGFLPQLSDKALEALAAALEADDPRLIQLDTTHPPEYTLRDNDNEVERACAIGFAGWQGEGLTTVEEVLEFFAQVCFKADQLLGEPAGCRWFLNTFDTEPRKTFFPALAEEIRSNLAQRKALVA